MVASFRPVIRFFIATALLVLAPTVLLGQKTDKVTMINGDVVTGEVKQLDRGKLQYKTDDMGTLSIKWDKVLRLASANYFEVRTRDGRRYFGRLDEPPTDGLLLVTLTGTDTLALPEVIGIQRIRQNFFGRLDGYIDVGFSFVKANRVVQFTTGAEARYRAENASHRLTGKSFLQTTNDTNKTANNSLEYIYSRFFTGKLILTGGASFSQNDELNLASRISGVVAPGYDILRSNSIGWWVAAGLVINNEKFTDASASQVTIEAVITSDFEVFRFDSPKMDLSALVSVFPSLSETGRVRVDSRARLAYEVFKDFTIGLTWSQNYDSRGSGGLTKNDINLSTTVGWTF